jgi:hypothetical protein
MMAQMPNDKDTTPVVAGAKTGGSRRRWPRTAREVLDSTKRAAEDGLGAVKTRARGDDRVGEATYRALDLASTGLDAAGRALRQLGDATRPIRGNPPATTTRAPKSSRPSKTT